MKWNTFEAKRMFEQSFFVSGSIFVESCGSIKFSMDYTESEEHDFVIFQNAFR